MKQFMTVVLFVVAAMAMFATGCAEEETCGGKTAQPPQPMLSGEFPLSQQDGEFAQGAGTNASIEVDRDGELVTVRYQLEDGSAVVETYAMQLPAEPIY